MFLTTLKISWFFIVIAVALIVCSCSTNKQGKSEYAEIKLSENETWHLSYRMVKSSILGETELGIKQFDTLLRSKKEIEPKFLNTGLELLHKKGEHQRVAQLFRKASQEAKTYICQKGWLAQSADGGTKSLCTDIEVKKATVTNPELQKELAIMFYNDQAVRGNAQPELLKKFDLTADSVSYNSDMAATDALNREKLKSIIAKHGFPDKAIVGEMGMESIFLVIQHADNDKEFQVAQFPHIEAAVKRGDLDGQKYALLYDRIKINAGEPQRYGTQFSKVDSENAIAELAPVEDIENLDKRRKEMDMMPIQVYRELMLSFYKKQSSK